MDICIYVCVRKCEFLAREKWLRLHHPWAIRLVKIKSDKTQCQRGCGETCTLALLGGVKWAQLLCWAAGIRRGFSVRYWSVSLQMRHPMEPALSPTPWEVLLSYTFFTLFFKRASNFVGTSGPKLPASTVVYFYWKVIMWINFWSRNLSS